LIATRVIMKTRAAYNKQVDLLRKCHVFFQHNGSDYLVSQIVFHKNGEDTIYSLYGTSVTGSDPINYSQDVPGDYDLRVKRIIQKHDLYRYLILISAPALTLLAIYRWRPVFESGMFFSPTALVLPVIITVLAIICWQVFRDQWL